MEPVITIFITIAFIAAVFFAWYFSHQARAKERALLIEKAFEKDLNLNTLPKELLEARAKFQWLKVGIVISGTSLGFLIGLVLQDWGVRWAFPPLLMFLFAGISMILAHYIARHREDDQE